ncbi:hypothetical protein TSUD_300860 [Trifolium subterraneum]|uniref:Uncharacterized protein n=1 Tax=Trifolium subterraneum TaxID=3900 RepID=A0A2Z6PE64_TRISU|nr:hypothetical protein TSUD_300860 [Trifolium subterraneum]
MRDDYAASRTHVDRPRFFHDSNANMTRFHHAREDQSGPYSYGVEFLAARHKDEDEKIISKREGAARGSSDGGRDCHREAGDID